MIWDPSLELGHQGEVKRMMREECQAFAFDSDSVGYILSLKMHRTMTSAKDRHE